MAKIARLDRGAKEALKEFLSALLREGVAEGVFALGRTENGTVAYFLFTSEDTLKHADPLLPLMPMNAARAVSRFSMVRPSPAPLAAVLRPCEARALVELVKLEQANLENLLIISYTCGGVFPLEANVNGELEKLLPSYREALLKGENAEGIRPNCAGCDSFEPLMADIVLHLVGRDWEAETIFEFATDKGLEVAEKMGMEVQEADVETPALLSLRETRQTEKARMLDELRQRVGGLENLLSLFGKCIGCHACREACPICYCKECFFESATLEYSPSDYLGKLERKGALRLPPDTLLFHLGRMLHVSLSCVACGMCEDVCPMDIPVGRVFKLVGHEAQKLFEYVPGRDVEEKLPLTTFKEEEFLEVAE